MRSLLALTAIAMAGCGRERSEANAPVPASPNGTAVATNPAPLPERETAPQAAPPPPDHRAAAEVPARSPIQPPSVAPTAKLPEKSPLTPAVPKPSYVDVQPSKTLNIELARLTHLMLSPEGGVIAVAGSGPPKSGAAEQDLTLCYNLGSGQKIEPPFPSSELRRLSNKGASAAYQLFEPKKGGDIHDYSVVVRDMATGEKSVITSIRGGLNHSTSSPYGMFALSSDGKLIITGLDGVLAFLKVPSGAPAFPQAKNAQPFIRMSNIYSADSRIATLSKGGLVTVWDLTTGKSLDELPLGNVGESANEFEVSPDGLVMKVLLRSGPQVWDLQSKKELTWDESRNTLFDSKTLFAHPMSGGLLYSSRGKHVISNFSVEVIDAKTGSLRYRLIAPGVVDAADIHGLSASDDGRRIVAASLQKKQVYVWDLPEGSRDKSRE